MSKENLCNNKTAELASEHATPCKCITGKTEVVTDSKKKFEVHDKVLDLSFHFVRKKGKMREFQKFLA